MTSKAETLAHYLFISALELDEQLSKQNSVPTWTNDTSQIKSSPAAPLQFFYQVYLKCRIY